MKQMYANITDYDEDRKTIDRCELLDRELETIPLDCQYNVDSIGHSLIRVFIHPIEKEFTSTMLVKVMKELRLCFDFKNQAPPKDASTYDEDKYRWKRDFREEGGAFYMTRRLEKHWDDADLYFLIEQCPKLNCKIVKKTKTVEYYEADCSKEMNKGRTK